MLYERHGFGLRATGSVVKFEPIVAVQVEEHLRVGVESKRAQLVAVATVRVVALRDEARRAPNVNRRIVEHLYCLVIVGVDSFVRE